MDEKKKAVLIESAEKLLRKNVPDADVLVSIKDLGVEESEAKTLLQEAIDKVRPKKEEPKEPVKVIGNIKEQVTSKKVPAEEENELMEKLDEIEKKIDTINEKISDIPENKKTQKK